MYGQKTSKKINRNVTKDCLLIVCEVNSDPNLRNA